MSEKLVSIFCLTYNHVGYIRDALDGFVNQKTNFKYDVFVYDDASTDGTSDILMKYQEMYPDVFNVYISERNTWKDENRYKFLYDLEIKNLNAKYVAVCEGDDYWTDENKLQMQVDYMEAHPECSMYIHNCEWLECTTNTSKPGNAIDIDGEGDVSTRELILEKNGHPPTASFLYRRELLQQDFFFFNAVVGDYPLMLCAASVGKVHYNNKIMSVYRYKAKGSWSSRLTSESYENKLFQCYHYIGVMDFLFKYNRYTDFKYKNIVKTRILLCADSLIYVLEKLNLSEQQLYDSCVQHGFYLKESCKTVIRMGHKIAEYRQKTFMENKTKQFIDQYNNIVIMGTGKYSQILSQQFENYHIDFEGYSVTKLMDNKKKFNEKKVWQLNQLPYDKEELGVVVGILIKDKEDIVKSLKEAGIVNYIMPYDFDWLLDKECSD